MVNWTRPAGREREPFLQGDSWQLKPDTKINVFHWSVWERAQRGGGGWKNWIEEVLFEEKITDLEDDSACHIQFRPIGFLC